MHGRSLLGAADVDDTALLTMVARLNGVEAADLALLDCAVSEFPYDLESITTAGRYLVRGRASDGERILPFSFFVKVIQSFARSRMFAVVPAELREWAEASVPWRTEAHAYRSDLADRLPPGLTMPRAVDVRDLDDSSVAIWLEELRVVPVVWDARRRERAARLLGRLAGSPRVAELATLGPEEWTVRDYLHGRLRHVVLPLLRGDAVWRAPLVTATFDADLRAALLRAADRVEDLVEEAMALPQAAAHGDACRNNLLATEDDPDFTLIDFGFWRRGPIGTDLGQLLVGEVQLGREAAVDLAARGEANLHAYVRGLRDEGCTVPEDSVRRGHALQLMLFTGLSSVPFELLDREPTPELFAVAAERAALASFCLETLDRTDALARRG